MQQHELDQLSYESLQRIIRAIDVHSRSLLRNFQLTGTQLGVLKELERYDQVPIGSLAKSRFLGAPTVTGVVDRLEKNGWVERVHGQEDRRQVLIRITSEGKKLLSRNPPLLTDEFCRKLQNLPEPKRQSLCESLQCVAGMMESSALDAYAVSHLKQPTD